jgi:hypothetical protein
VTNFPATPFVYIRWTESSTGADSTVVSEVPLLGNRVDRFIWNGSTLTLDRNLIQLRSRQMDNIAVPGHLTFPTNAAEQANHNGGVLRFGPDGKLYLFMGDQGRRGWLQNLPNGPFLDPPQVDDGFGGPAPDNAHFTGVIVRLNEDGSTPTESPVRIPFGSPPLDGIDQTLPPAAMKRVFPSGVAAKEVILPLSNAIRREIVPVEMSAIATSRCGVGRGTTVMKAISLRPSAVAGINVSSAVFTSGTGFFPVSRPINWLRP